MSMMLTFCECTPGSSGPDGGPCTKCATGTFKGVIGSASCSNCGAGKYSPQHGATDASVCTDCGAGKYLGSQGNAAEADCQRCVSGKYSTIQGATVASVCQSCLAGKYAELEGNTQETDCIECAACTSKREMWRCVGEQCENAARLKTPFRARGRRRAELENP